MRNWARLTCWYWRVSWGGRGWLWLTAGTKRLAAVAVASTHWCELSWRLPFPPKTSPQPKASRLQCWDTSSQTTNREGTEPHPSADRLFKVFLSTALPTRGTWTSSTHQWAGTRPSHQQAWASLLDSLTHQREDSRSKKNYNPAACRTETTITES